MLAEAVVGEDVASVLSTDADGRVWCGVCGDSWLGEARLRVVRTSSSFHFPSPNTGGLVQMSLLPAPALTERPPSEGGGECSTSSRSRCRSRMVHVNEIVVVSSNVGCVSGTKAGAARC